MPRAGYMLIREAILNEQQVTCLYSGHAREICPHIIGRTGGEETLLAWQFGGRTSSVLPPGGEWRCFKVSDMRDVKVRDGRWHTGSRHRTAQTCVGDVDLDVNIHVRKRHG
jgi:predicted DNA-binding transcriptional regulator YafY